MADAILKSLITASSYRTKWGLPEYTINGNTVEASDNRHRNETAGTTWIQWDLGQPYILEKYDYYNMNSPWGMNGSSVLRVSNDPDFGTFTDCVRPWTTYGTDFTDEPFLDYTTTDPILEAYQYIRMPSANWGMVEITFYGATETTPLDLGSGGAAPADNPYLIRMPTSRGSRSYIDRFRARYDYRYQALAIVCIETSTDVWTVSPYPGVATIDMHDAIASSYIFYGGEEYTVAGALAAALTAEGYI